MNACAISLDLLCLIDCFTNFMVLGNRQAILANLNGIQVYVNADPTVPTPVAPRVVTYFNNIANESERILQHERTVHQGIIGYLNNNNAQVQHLHTLDIYYDKS